MIAFFARTINIFFDHHDLRNTYIRIPDEFQKGGQPGNEPSHVHKKSALIFS